MAQTRSGWWLNIVTSTHLHRYPDSTYIARVTMAALGSGRRDKCPLAEICGVSLWMVRAKCPMRTPSRLSSFFLFGPGRLRWLSASVVTSTDSPQRPPTTICLGPRMPHTVACPAGDPNPRAHRRIYLSIRIHLPGEIHSFFFFSSADMSCALIAPHTSGIRCGGGAICIQEPLRPCTHKHHRYGPLDRAGAHAIAKPVPSYSTARFPSYRSKSPRHRLAESERGYT